MSDRSLWAWWAAWVVWICGAFGPLVIPMTSDQRIAGLSLAICLMLHWTRPAHV